MDCIFPILHEGDLLYIESKAKDGEETLYYITSANKTHFKVIRLAYNCQYVDYSIGAPIQQKRRASVWNSAKCVPIRDLTLFTHLPNKTKKFFELLTRCQE